MSVASTRLSLSSGRASLSKLLSSSDGLRVAIRLEQSTHRGQRNVPSAQRSRASVSAPAAELAKPTPEPERAVILALSAQHIWQRCGRSPAASYWAADLVDLGLFGQLRLERLRQFGILLRPESPEM